MSLCTHHPGVPTDAACTHCGRPYCDACLVDFMGARCCGPCRDFRLAQVQGNAPLPPPTAADRIIPTRNPPALTGYYVGVFSLVPCVGLVAGPAAVVLGVIGLRAVRNFPELPGKAHAVTAIVLGAITSLANWGFILFGVAAAIFTP